MQFCDLRTGVCGDVTEPTEERIEAKASPKATILYATDPICSHCWAMEPAWRKLIFDYGEQISSRHIHGGLLAGWGGVVDAKNGISGPATVAPHWAEVAEHSGQPIDPSVWLKDPLSSSFPASIAVHAVRTINPALEEAYLRRIREAIFLEARNIAKEEVLIDCAVDIGLERESFAQALAAGAGKAGFQRDLAEVRQLKVHGFPTIIMTGEDGQGFVLRGAQSYERLEGALLELTGLERATAQPTAAEALAAYGSGTTKEFAELLGLSLDETQKALTAAGAKARPIAGDALWSNL